MSRYAARRDANEGEIVSALRQCGVSVMRMNEIDLLCGFRKTNVLLEIKDGEKKRGDLTNSQVIFRGEWRGQYDVVTSFDEALRVITKLTAGR